MTPEQYEQIGQLYQAALERVPAERTAFLDTTCGTDQVLRREVESLLAAHEQADDFIEQPPDNFAAAWQLAAGATRVLGHYRPLTLLGKGGMGEVWLAEDTHLPRKVAVKLLPEEFMTQPERVRRFAQEAHAASALNHPNILTIHEIGKTESTHYIVTEYVEGETLRQRINTAPEKRLRLTEALEITTQIAAALTAAHEAGIIHRDIKPENVMVRPDGVVKVLDFGLARITQINSWASTLVQESTQSSIVMGTPRYMSPEQARGRKVDARTDIFSLGVMLYEMVTGHPPFAGATISETIAAILRDEPPPLTAHVPDAPPALERLLQQALRKERSERYAAVADVQRELKSLQEELAFAAKLAQTRDAEATTLSQPLAAGDTAPAKSITNGLHRRTITVGVATCLLLVTVAAWFYFDRRPVLAEKDAILLADFENKTDEDIWEGILKQGLALQLQQSPFLRLFPDERVQQTLRLMQRSPEGRVTAAVAREICQREGIKAVIAGAVAKLGSRYVLTLEAINGQSGEPLARALVEAESREQVLQALSQGATELRAKLGESLSSIQRFNRPLEDATTANLEAFKFHAQAVVLAINGKIQEAISVEKRALELDPNFAYADSLLSIWHWNGNRVELAAEYAAKAYALRGRVSEFERLRLTFRYHLLVTGDLNQAIEALQLQKQMYPHVFSASNDLALAYSIIGQSEPEGAEAAESIRLNPNFYAPYFYLALSLQRQNRFAEAHATLTRALELKLDSPRYHSALYQLAFINNDPMGMQQQVEWMRGRPDEYVAFEWQSQTAAFAGQWHKAEDFSRRAIALALRSGGQEIAAQYETEQPLRGALFGACRQAQAEAAAGLKLYHSRVALPRAALAFALCGEANQTKVLTAELRQRYPEDTLNNELWLPLIHTALALRQGNVSNAIEQLQVTTRYEAAAEFWPQYLRGQAYLQLKKSAQATAEFQKILDHRGEAPLSVLYPLARLSLARAASLNGDTAKAHQAYEEFLALWKEAEQDVPVLKEARQEDAKIK